MFPATCIPGGANIWATFEQPITPSIFEKSNTDPDFQIAAPVLPRINKESVTAKVIPQQLADFFNLSPNQKNKKYILEKVAEGRVLTDKKNI